MKIAIVSIVFPYPIDNGGGAATFNMIDSLRHKHDITFICPNVKAENKQKLHELWPNVEILTTDKNQGESRSLKLYKNVLKINKFLKGKVDDYFYPKTHLYINDLSKVYYPELLKLVKDKVTSENFDLVQVEFIEFAGLVHILPKDLKKIFIHHELRFKRLEMEYQTLNTKSLEDKWHIAATKDLEIALLNHYDKVVTVTDTDNKFLAEAGIKKELLHTSTLPINFKETDINQPFQFKNNLVFLGPENHYPNLDGINWFLEECWDKISQAHPNLTLQIVSKWTTEFQNLHKSRKNVEFLGFVEDLSTVFDGSIMIVPLRIVSGMRMKILEGISWKMPIVSTIEGAEGLPMEDAENCMLASNSEEFIEKTIQLIENNKLCSKLIDASQKLITDQYQIEKCAKTRDALYNSFK
ncbi:glycosyltransferase [uncultured Arcticibacterium sp.]|uniref:glycosyltransferase n=1 Tax=uncultured Arcticibacterium sp. TaxID=2173042 RepID=UPI0030F5E5E1